MPKWNSHQKPLWKLFKSGLILWNSAAAVDSYRNCLSFGFCTAELQCWYRLSYQLHLFSVKLFFMYAIFLSVQLLINHPILSIFYLFFFFHFSIVCVFFLYQSTHLFFHIYFYSSMLKVSVVVLVTQRTNKHISNSKCRLTLRLPPTCWLCCDTKSTWIHFISQFVVKKQNLRAIFRIFALLLGPKLNSGVGWQLSRNLFLF